MKRKTKMVFGVVGTIFVMAAAGIILFVNLSPQFGASKKAIRTSTVINSPNYIKGAFRNGEETTVMAGFRISSIPSFFTNGNKVPDFRIPVQKVDASQINQIGDSLSRVTWFGHSTVLIETAGKTIFIDPMMGNVPSPVSWAGSGRFNPELPIEIESLPFIDVVLISHDHYDHLDYGSIVKLKEKVGTFYVPLGVGAHLRSWGVDSGKIVELDWWDSKTHDDLTFIATPARHFSGRGIFDRNSTLWCSWVIQSQDANIFFSGDSGYGKHFREIGNKYGPFDFAMMECGQYNEQWPLIHMMPEEVPLAMADLKAQVFMPIHWGIFKLALHPWTDPVVRLQNAIHATDLKMVTPAIGQGFFLNGDQPTPEWWLE